MSIEAEQAVLGGLMLLGADSEQAVAAMSVLTPGSFSAADHQIIFAAISMLAERGDSCDPLTVTELAKKDRRYRPEIEALVMDMAINTPTAANLRAYAEIVRESAVERFAVAKMNEALAVMTDPYQGNIYKRLGLAESMISAIQDRAMRNRTAGLRHVKDVGREWLDEVERRMEGKQRGFTLGIKALDDLLAPKRVPAGSLVVIGARPKQGKEQPLDSKVLMADGSWKVMGDIRLGDMVASPDGRPSRVTGIFPQGVKDVYEVEFSDGRKVECGLEHLWTVNSSRFARRQKTITTAELMRLLTMDRYKSRMSLPEFSGEFGETVDLGMDPWLLGVFLGDGCISGETTRFSNSEAYILDRVSAAIPDGLRITPDGSRAYRISGERGRTNPITASLRALGVMGCTASSKHIPELVFSADKSTRWGVLSGILETDGWVEKSGSLAFSSASQRLAEGVARLVWSLGGVARCRVRTNIRYSYKGEKLDGQDAHVVVIRLPDVREHIRSPRLLKNIKQRQAKTATPVFVAVRKVRRAECQCIMVDHDAHLYVTDNFVLTHNTAILGRIATHYAVERNEAVAVFSLEMPERQIYERLMVGSANVDPGIFYKAPDSADPWHSVSRAAAQFNESQLYIDDTPGVRLSHIQREVRALNRKHRVGLVAVDYLTLMEAESAERNDLGYARITKGLKNLAKELDCVVLLLTQLNRNLEARPNKRPLPSDSRDTGQIEQDCDLWIGLYRDASYHDGAPPGLTEAIVRLNRHGGTGTAYFDLVNGAVAEVDQDWARSASDQAPQKVTRLRV